MQKWRNFAKSGHNDRVTERERVCVSKEGLCSESKGASRERWWRERVYVYQEKDRAERKRVYKEKDCVHKKRETVLQGLYRESKSVSRERWCIEKERERERER